MPARPHTPRLIPVLDVMGGVVVRAVGGRRDEYRPVVSKLTGSTEPVAAARALLDATGAAELYVADLDAIRGGSGVSPAVARLFGEFATPVWVDVGVNAVRPVMSLPRLPNVRPVVGLETAPEPRLLAEALGVWEGPVAFSIDLKESRLLGAWGGWGAAHDRDALGVGRRAVAVGARTLIVLDLARVGTGSAGGTENLLRAIRGEFPEVELIAGGGVKTRADVDRLGEAGADAVLVASALHDGTLVADGSAERR